MRGATARSARSGVEAGFAVRWAAAVTLVGGLLLLGCGSSSAPSVATVQGTAISRAALSHWTRIKRAELQRSPGSKASSAQKKALAFLITADWLQAESRAQGIQIPSSDVEATYRRLVSGAAGHSFASSLRDRGLSRSDELLLLRLQGLSSKLQAKVAAGSRSVSATQIAAYYSAHRSEFRGRRHMRSLSAVRAAIRSTLVEAGRRRRVATFAAAFRKRWKQRTICRRGYIVPECRNGPALSSSTG
jgi:hypothetical protein